MLNFCCVYVCVCFQLVRAFVYTSAAALAMLPKAPARHEFVQEAQGHIEAAEALFDDKTLLLVRVRVCAYARMCAHVLLCMHL